MKFALAFLGVLALSALKEANGAVCSSTFKGATNQFISDICPAFAATKNKISDIVACKQRNGEMITESMKECARQYNNNNYADPEYVVKNVMCNKNQPQLANEWACCYMTVASAKSGRMGADRMTKICVGCINDTKFDINK